MLVSTYHVSDTERARARRQWVEARPVVIGTAPDCPVVLDDPEVAPHHVRLSEHRDGILVENLGPAVDVGGTPVANAASTQIAEGVPIRIGGTVVKVRLQRSTVVETVVRPQVGPTANPPPMWNPPPINYDAIESNPPPPAYERPLPVRPMTRTRRRKDVLSANPTEQSFLVTLRASPNDTSTRMVYADWLETQGQLPRAELVRLAEYLDTMRHRDASDIDWRAVVARTPIEHCMHNRCPKLWDALAPVEHTDFARTCGTCSKPIPFCGDLAEVRAAAFDEVPVVFDIGLDRIAAHQSYRRYGDEPAFSTTDNEDDIEDDEGYTIDTPPSNYRR